MRKAFDDARVWYGSDSIDKLVRGEKCESMLLPKTIDLILKLAKLKRKCRDLEF